MGAWIEIIIEQQEKKLNALSHPTMGAWIEIRNCIKCMDQYEVAPHDGCVDWNMAKS